MKKWDSLLAVIRQHHDELLDLSTLCAVFVEIRPCVRDPPRYAVFPSKILKFLFCHIPSFPDYALDKVPVLREQPLLALGEHLLGHN